MSWKACHMYGLRAQNYLRGAQSCLTGWFCLPYLCAAHGIHCGKHVLWAKLLGLVCHVCVEYMGYITVGMSYVRSASLKLPVRGEQNCLEGRIDFPYLRAVHVICCEKNVSRSICELKTTCPGGKLPCRKVQNCLLTGRLDP